MQQFTLFTGCPDGGEGGPMVELLQLANTDEVYADSFFGVFIESSQGEGGGGRGGSSGGCHDEEQGLFCEGPCP